MQGNRDILFSVIRYQCRLSFKHDEQQLFILNKHTWKNSHAVAGSQIPVDDVFAAKILHPSSDIQQELNQHLLREGLQTQETTALQNTFKYNAIKMRLIKFFNNWYNAWNVIQCGCLFKWTYFRGSSNRHNVFDFLHACVCMCVAQLINHGVTLKWWVLFQDNTNW